MADTSAKSPDQRRRLNAMLMASQYDRPTYYDQAPVERAGLLPLGTYPNGQTGLAFPGFITEPVNSWNRLLTAASNGERPSPEDSFNVAGAAMVGGLAAPRPRPLPHSAVSEAVTPAMQERANALWDRMQEQQRPTDMALDQISQASSGQAIREQGWHGTTENRLISKGRYNRDDGGPWGSSNRDVADDYTHLYMDDKRTVTPNGAMTVPVEYRFNQPMVFDANGRHWTDLGIGPSHPIDTDNLAEAAMARGHDGLVVRNVDDRQSGVSDMLSTVYKPLQPGTAYSPLTGDILYANGGRQGAATGAAVNALDRPGIGHNNPPPTVSVRGQDVEINPSRLSGRYATDSDLNEALLQSGGNIESVIRQARRDLAIAEKDKAANASWFRPDTLERAQSSLDNALAYQAGLGRFSGFAEKSVENMPFGQTWYHATNAGPFEQFKPSAEGALGPGVYVGQGKAATKSVIPDAEKFSGDGPRRLLSAQYRGELMPYNDYLRLAEDIASKTGIDAGSTEMSNALSPMLRKYGYSGVKDQSSDYGRYGAIFDPSDVRITGQELYANGGRQGAATGAAVNASADRPVMWHGGTVPLGDTPTVSHPLKLNERGDSVFYSPYREASSDYAGPTGTVQPYELSPTKTFVWDIDNLPDTQKRLSELWHGKTGAETWHGPDAPGIFDALRSSGYDSIDLRLGGRTSEFGMLKDDRSRLLSPEEQGLPPSYLSRRNTVFANGGPYGPALNLLSQYYGQQPQQPHWSNSMRDGDL